MIYDIKTLGPGKNKPIVLVSKDQEYIDFPYKIVGNPESSSSVPQFFVRTKKGESSLDNFQITVDNSSPIIMETEYDENEEIANVKFYLKGTYNWLPEIDVISIGKYEIEIDFSACFERFYISPRYLYSKKTYEGDNGFIYGPNNYVYTNVIVRKYYYSNFEVPDDLEKMKNTKYEGIKASFTIEITEENQENEFKNIEFLAEFSFPDTEFLTLKPYKGLMPFDGEEDFFSDLGLNEYGLKHSQGMCFNANALEGTDEQKIISILRQQTDVKRGYEREDTDDIIPDSETQLGKINIYSYKKWSKGRKGSFYTIYNLDKESIKFSVYKEGENHNDSFTELDLAKNAKITNNLIQIKPSVFLEKNEYYIKFEDGESKKEQFVIKEKPEVEVFYDSLIDIVPANQEVPVFFQYKDFVWYQYQLINTSEGKEFIVYDTNKIYSSYKGKIPIILDTLLPNETYYIKFYIGDIYKNTFTFSSNTFTTIHPIKELNFLDKKFNSYVSESFVKLNLFELGYGARIYPSDNLFPKDEIYPMNFSYHTDWKYIKILRQNLNTKKSKWIATIEKPKDFDVSKDNIICYDYSIKANQSYDYWVYIAEADSSEAFPPIEEVPEDELIPMSFSEEENWQNENIFVGVKINSEPIIAEWDRWTLVTADKDPEDKKVYHVDKVFTFEMNLSSGNMTNGTNITTSKNFTEFPIVQKDKSNFYSGSLTALMGVRKWGSTAKDFEQTPQMLEDLRQLSTNYQPKFLKDRSGHLWQVEINGAIQVANTDNLATIDLKTMTVPWVQIGEADDISLIYTGTEKKEALYC